MRFCDRIPTLGLCHGRTRQMPDEAQSWPARHFSRKGSGSAPFPRGALFVPLLDQLARLVPNFSPATWMRRDEMALHVFLAAYTSFTGALVHSLEQVILRSGLKKIGWVGLSSEPIESQRRQGTQGTRGFSGLVPQCAEPGPGSRPIPSRPRLASQARSAARCAGRGAGPSARKRVGDRLPCP
jgi:hypothetical protein